MPPPHIVPDWIEIRTGNAPLLLFAPHGGRRVAPRQPGRHKVNDLHTAALTRELAAACDATCIVNAARDRNELDLNRVEQVRRRAPWLLDLLADTLEAMVARAGRATILVIHGWNVVQSACDVGIGLVERDGACMPAGDGRRTASERFLAATLRPLQRLAAREHIAVTIGARYPGAHPNNLLQLFTSTRGADSEPAIRRIAALAARVDAAQLELGIPLRWPGPRRALFVRLLAQALAAGPDAAAGDAGIDVVHHSPLDATAASRRALRPGAPASWSPAGEGQATGQALACGGRVAARRALQFADGELVGMTSIDAGEAGAIAGRLLISPCADRLLLFTGELARRRGGLSVPQLEYLDGAAGAFRVRYAGPLLSFPSLTPFLDLESGLAGGDLVETSVDLLFTPRRPLGPSRAWAAAFGMLGGTIVLAGARRHVHTLAQATESSPRPPARYPFVRLTLLGTPLGHLALTSRGDDADGGRAPHARQPFAAELELTVDLGGASVVDSSSVEDAEGEAVTGTCELALTSNGGRLRATVAKGAASTRQFEGALERLIPVRRPGAAGTVIQTIYALCRFPDLPPGWLEVSVEHVPAPETRRPGDIPGSPGA